MADESLISLNDGRFLAENDFVDFFNIRISKNGGLLPALRLAELAAKHFLGGQLGALPGESGILTAAERHFLQMVPNIDFTETAYATFSLRQDIVDRKMRFGYGGKLDILDRSGLGIGLHRKNLGKFVIGLPGKIHLT
jgi:muconate cycloisomerase